MFAKIVSASLANRIMVLVGTCVLLVWGAVIIHDMPVDLLPETRPPSVVVTAEAGTLTAEEIELQIVRPIERALNGLAGVTAIRSAASASVAYFQIQFGWNTDIFRNRQLVQERLQIAQTQLPSGVVPMLAPMAAATGLIMQTGVTGGTGPMALREYADWTLRPRLLAVAGVSQVFVIGGEVRTFQFTPNLALLHYYRLTLGDVEKALSRFAINSSGGFVDIQGTGFALQNISRTSNLDDMRAIVVAYRDTTPLLLGDLGKVEFAAAYRPGQSSFNGTPSVNLTFVKQPQANTVQVAAAIGEVLEEMRATAPPGIEVGMVSYNQADLILESISNVGTVLRDAVIIVTLVLMVFLGGWRPTFISLMAIPVSLVISAIVFKIMGVTLNTMTLGGIAIAIGALVDDAVVNVENILRRLRENTHRHRPRPVMNVIADASQEVRSGIVYSTLIVLVVFIPLMALPGPPGRMFVPLATAFVVSIFASLIVSVTVSPALSYYLLPVEQEMKRVHGGRVMAWLTRWNDMALRWVLREPRIVLSAAAAVVIIAAAAIFVLPRSFLPTFNEGNVYVTLTLTPDTSMAEAYRVGNAAEQLIRNLPEVKAMSHRAGRYDEDSDVDPVYANEWALKVRLDNGRTLKELMADIRQRMSVFPGTLNVSQFLLDRMQAQDNMVRGDIILKVFGPDLATIRLLAEKMQTPLRAIPGLVDIAVEQQAFSPQHKFSIDYRRAALFGITPADITERLGSFVNGKVVSQILDEGRRFDVVIRLDDDDRNPYVLENLRFDTPAGSIPLSSFATSITTTGPSRILHEDGARRIAVMANTDGRQDMAQTVRRVREMVGSLRLPPGYHIAIEGDFRHGEKSRIMLGLLTPLALLLMFLLLHHRFRSVMLSLIIMGNIPLALVGSVAALWLAGLDVDLPALIGFIAVTGVAVRNSLLKVGHFINLHLHENIPFGRDLVIRGARERLMPVLMTALATGLALVPLLWSSDSAGTEILHPVAVAIFGGLISSTLLDAFTTPLLFHLFGEQAATRMILTHHELAHETF